MRQQLIVDADDTLWENNIYFERAFDQFVEFLSHSSLAAPEIRSILDEIEIANAKIHGYGSLNFGRNLSQCYRRLVEREVRPEDLERVMAFAERILDHPIELIPGVEETLQYLAPRHDLLLFTKGHPEEQKIKIDRSGLASHFKHVVIVKEKDAVSYTRLVEDLKLDRQRTWMIGNSPKSDINPALEIGVNAVFVPHARTWTLERERIREGAGRLVVLEKFSELRTLF